MINYLEDKEISTHQVISAIRSATLLGHIVPVLCGAAYKNMGIQMLLDSVVDFLPSPLDVPITKGHTPAGEVATRSPSDKSPFSALIFKIMTDPYVGKLTYFRVYSGTLNVGDYILNISKGKREKISRILLMHANKRQDLTSISTSDIVAAIGLKYSATGDTLCSEDDLLF